MGEKKGLRIGSTYKSAQDFMHFTAEAERQKLKKALATKTFMSVMSDSSVMEEELVCVRFTTAG